MTVLATAQGLFGPVWISEQRGARFLSIGREVQGGSLLDESGQPGPVADSNYMSGWLAAGTQAPDASMVMLGLGSGAGPVALLTCFPEIDLTVVEIDPVVIKLCCAQFPLVNSFIDQGRLRIVNQDAGQYLEWAHARGDHWDVGLADTYTGENFLAIDGPAMKTLIACTDHVWVNFIGVHDGKPVQSIISFLSKATHPVTSLFDAQVNVLKYLPHNLILTTVHLDHQLLDEFEPYEDYEGPGVEEAREKYRVFIKTEQQL